MVQKRDSSCFIVVTRLQKSVRMELTRASAVRVGGLGTEAKGGGLLFSSRTYLITLIPFVQNYEKMELRLSENRYFRTNCL